MMHTEPIRGQGMRGWLNRPAIAIVLAASTVLLPLFDNGGRSNDNPQLPPVKEEVDFTRDVRPILEKRCVSCHGPAKQQGGLRLDSAAAVQKGGASGDVVLAGWSADSLLIRHVAGVGDAIRMSPEGDPLTKEQIRVLRAWIDQGAKGPATSDTSSTPSATLGWAWLPLQRSTVPTTPAEHRGWLWNPVDAFVLEKLLAHGLRPSPEADRRTLIRRLSLDLTGMPPAFDEVDAFVVDTAPNA